MKSIAVFFVIIAVVVQSFARCITIAGFALNRSYIAKVLCENKARPKLKCGGRCQLMKKMAAQEEENSTTSHLLKVPEFISVLSLEDAVPMIEGNKIPHCTGLIHFAMQQTEISIFHPPSFV